VLLTILWPLPLLLVRWLLLVLLSVVVPRLFQVHLGLQLPCKLLIPPHLLLLSS
jgi:hypothetical protein